MITQVSLFRSIFKVFAIVALFIVSQPYNSRSQISDSAVDKLIPLKRSKYVTQPYVNFDVLKLLVGQGVASYGGEIFRPVAISFQIQFLYPIALLKEAPVHIAVGASIGRSQFAYLYKRLNVIDGTLVSLVTRNDLRKSVVRVNNIGVVVLPFVQVTERVQVFAGARLDFNVFNNKLTTKKGEIRSSHKIGHDIKTISVPLMLQASYKLSNVVSLGMFGSYDALPRFRKADVENPLQIVFGFTSALVL